MNYIQVADHKPTSIDESTRWLRRLCIVPRWTVVPTIKKQSVAEHVFGVVVIAQWLVCKFGPYMEGYVGNEEKFMHDVMATALMHDVSEAASGDIPSPAKRHEADQICGLIDNVVKVADTLEAIVFLVEEMSMGNTSVHSLVRGLESKYIEDWPLLRIDENPVTVLKHVLRISRASDHPAMRLPK